MRGVRRGRDWLLDATNGNDVPTAVVNGRLVMRGGRVLTADQDRAVQQA